ncbi:MAG: hypothetical protein MUC51_03105 [Anaerolineae bacterium]|jgi:hypothetical protein|nr:hypothetical protein [Anaerolineae bacterium]
MDWLETRLDLTNPGLWILASSALAVLAANAAWVLLRLTRGRLRLGRLLRSSGTRALVWLVVSLYLLLMPLFAWRYGAISPYFLGLSELDWVGSITAGGLLAVLLIALVLFGWLVYRHALPADQAETPPTEGRFIHALRAPIDAALAQWHLAFYRAGAIGWLTEISALPAAMPGPLRESLQSQPFYWGSWLGLGVLLVESVLNPHLWAVLGTPTQEERAWGRPEAILRSLALAVGTTALFILTRNLWLCLACQVIVETAIAGWLPLHRPQAGVPDTV